MDIIIELQSDSDAISVEPAACSITQAVCNDSLQHVENSCEVKLVYDPDLFAFIVSHERMDAVVKKRDGAVLFTGIAGADASWADRGEPYPIDGLALSIKDYTAKLDIQNGGEIAFLDVLLTDVLHRLAGDCGITVIDNTVPYIVMDAFVMPPEQNYRQTLDALCYQYQLAFYFDNLGRLNFFYFGDIPADPLPLGQSDILAGARIKKSRKRYDRVIVEYTTLTRKENEQVFFESFGYNSDNSPAPAVIQPGVYYPFDASPAIEASEGKVYQSFVSGYAESRKKYNGELEFRRSKDTSLLYTCNHHVVQDWDGPLQINRTEFESLRASVRFLNTGNADASLRQFAIRADAVYRNKAASVTAGAGERTFSTDAEFIYQAAYAESLAQTLHRFFFQSSLCIDLSTDTAAIPPGSYRKIDTGKSGLIVDTLLYSSTLDCDKEIYTYKAVSVGPAAVDVFRSKSAESDPFRGDPGVPGVPGAPGEDGLGISSIEYKFRCTNTDTKPTQTWSDSGWSTTIPALDATNRWLWYIERITYTDSATQDTVGLQAVHGQTGSTGAVGNYHEARYRRAAARPATPTGDNPTNWTTDPSSHSGSDPLWMTRGIKNAAGALQGAWSVPVQITGEDGLGIDALPRDPYAYWSCDDLPLFPDNPAGIVGNKAFAYKKAVASNVSGMTAMTGQLSLQNGSVQSRGCPSKPNWLFTGAQYNGKILIARIRYNVPVGIPLIEYASANNFRPMKVLHQFSDREYLVCDLLELASRSYVWFGLVGDDITGWLDEFYVGDASYLTPLIDNSGNGRHMALPGGIIPVPGRFGNGIRFFNAQTASVSGILDGHTGDFAVSVWSNKPTHILGKGSPTGWGMGFGIYGGRAQFVTASSETRVGTSFNEDGNMHHMVVMVKSKVMSLYVDGQLSSTINITSSYNGPLGTHNFTIGAGLRNSGPAADGTVIDEIAVFDRALAGQEIKALYKTALPKFYTNAVNALQNSPVYRGPVSTADTANTGIINGVKVNHGDYVMFTGSSGWTRAYLYEWNAVNKNWKQLPREGNWDKYLDGVSDLSGAEAVGVFSATFIKTLFAQTVNAEHVNVKMKLLIGSLADGIEIDGVNGEIKSRNYVSGQSGFVIRKNKANDVQAEFIDAKIKNGEFDGSLIVADAWDANGNVNNVNAQGAFLACDKKLANGMREIRIKDLTTYGDTWLGTPFINVNVRTKIIFRGNRVHNNNSYAKAGNPMRIGGHYTAQGLFDAINNIFSEEETGNSGSSAKYPITGSLAYYVSGNYMPVILSCMEKVSGGQWLYWLYGMNLNRVRIVFLVSSSNITVANTEGGSVTTITGNSTCTAEFLFL